MFATIFSFARSTFSRHFGSLGADGDGTFWSLGCSGTRIGGFLGRSPPGVGVFERPLDRANALLVLCSTGGNPVFGAGDLDDENDEEAGPGVLSRTDPISWAFAEALGISGLAMDVLVKGGEQIAVHVLRESNTGFGGLHQFLRSSR